MSDEVVLNNAGYLYCLAVQRSWCEEGLTRRFHTSGLEQRVSTDGDRCHYFSFFVDEEFDHDRTRSVSCSRDGRADRA